jgi:hypothetical protein
MIITFSLTSYCSVITQGKQIQTCLISRQLAVGHFVGSTLYLLYLSHENTWINSSSYFVTDPIPVHMSHFNTSKIFRLNYYALCLHFQIHHQWWHNNIYIYTYIYILITITVLDIIRSTVFYLKHNFPETWFWLLHMATTQFGSIDRGSLCLCILGQLRRFHLKTETESSFWKVFEIKHSTMDNVNNCDSFIDITLSQTY